MLKKAEIIEHCNSSHENRLGTHYNRLGSILLFKRSLRTNIGRFTKINIFVN